MVDDAVSSDDSSVVRVVVCLRENVPVLKRLLSNLRFTQILFGLVLLGFSAVVPAVTGALAQAEPEAAPAPSQTVPDMTASEDPAADQTAVGSAAPSTGQNDSSSQTNAAPDAETDVSARVDNSGGNDAADDAPAESKRPSFTVTDISKSMTVLKDCNVRAGPFNSEPVIEIAFHDSVVQATGWVQGPNWYRIELGDGDEGYIHGSLLEETTATDGDGAENVVPAAPTYYVPGQPMTGLPDDNISADVPSEEQLASREETAGPGGPNGPSNTLPSFPSYALPKPEMPDRSEVESDADQDAEDVEEIAQNDSVQADAEQLDRGPQVAALDEDPEEARPAVVENAAGQVAASEPEAAAVVPPSEDLRQSVETVVTSSIESSAEAAETLGDSAADKAATPRATPSDSVQMAAKTGPVPALEGKEFSPEPRTKPTLGDLAAQSVMRVPDPLAPAGTPNSELSGGADEAGRTVAALDKTMYISEDAEVHSEPSYSSELITVLHAPNAIKVTGWVEDAGWYRVAMLDGGTGFVSALMLSEEFIIPSMDILQEEDAPAGEATLASAGMASAAAAGLSGDWYVSHVKILDADYAQPKPAQPTFTGKGDDGKLEIFEAGRLRYSLSVNGDRFLGTEFNYSCGKFTELPVRGSVSEDGVLSIEYQMMMDGCDAVPPKGPVVYQLTRF